MAVAADDAIINAVRPEPRGLGLTEPPLYLGMVRGDAMADINDALAKRGVVPLTDDDLRGNDITTVKCRACSGYGACGYKTFYLYESKPYSVCNLRLDKVRNGELTPEQKQAEQASA